MKKAASKSKATAVTKKSKTKTAPKSSAKKSSAEMKSAELISKSAQYYSKKLAEFGPTPKGVDWNSAESQNLRFTQLCKALPEADKFTLLDYGCGYGSLLTFLQRQNLNFEYFGYDASASMIKAAKTKNAMHGHFAADLAQLPQTFDAVTCSGVFNVKLKTPASHWQKYVFSEIQKLNKLAKKSFAFNLLSSYSDKDRMRPDLFYGDPLVFFDFCKKSFSKDVALLHDYGLYEFTILVRKEL